MDSQDWDSKEYTLENSNLKHEEWVHEWEGDDRV